MSTYAVHQELIPELVDEFLRSPRLLGAMVADLLETAVANLLEEGRRPSVPLHFRLVPSNLDDAFIRNEPSRSLMVLHVDTVPT